MGYLARSDAAIKVSLYKCNKDTPLNYGMFESYHSRFEHKCRADILEFGVYIYDDIIWTYMKT